MANVSNMLNNIFDFICFAPKKKLNLSGSPELDLRFSR
jgi:hypothetical protein